MPPRIAALFLPAIFAVACVTAAPPQSQEERGLPADGSIVESSGGAGRKYNSGGSLQSSWNDTMVAEHAELDRELMASLSATLNESIPYRDFSSVARGSCDLLDDEVDFNKPESGLSKLHSQGHKIEARVAVWLYVKSGAQWDGYCDWHRTNPEPTPWPTATTIPPTPLTACMGWEDFGDLPCGLGGTSVGQQFRVKILAEGQAGRLEVTYPRRPPDAPDSVLCGHPSATTGFHQPAGDNPVFVRFETCAEGLVEFVWVPWEGKGYTYQLRVVNPG